jgi:hypothetical protein
MAFKKYGDKSGSVILFCLLGGAVTAVAWILCILGTAFDPVIGQERPLNWFSHETGFFELTGALTVAAGTLVTPKQAWIISAWINAGISAVIYELFTISTIARPWVPRPWDVDDFGFGITCGGMALIFTALGIFYFGSNGLSRK